VCPIERIKVNVDREWNNQSDSRWCELSRGGRGNLTLGNSLRGIRRLQLIYIFLVQLATLVTVIVTVTSNWCVITLLDATNLPQQSENGR
jgi:steroid 5-alpha reductase family enzyme